MISYSQVASKEDRKFHRIARRVIGNDYGAACAESSEAFVDGYKSGTETTRVNLGRRAANLVILKWMSDYGVTNWQDLDAPQIKRAPAKNAQRDFVSKKVNDRKFKSDDKLWSKKL